VPNPKGTRCVYTCVAQFPVEQKWGVDVNVSLPPLTFVLGQGRSPSGTGTIVVLLRPSLTARVQNVIADNTQSHVNVEGQPFPIHWQEDGRVAGSHCCLGDAMIFVPYY
jgi:hypothetical protein